jgi:hypothetical protein
MYPAHFFGLYPPFPQEDRVFVAMSFDPRFDQRWENVIAPAIGRISANDRPLEPFRVNARKVSDSILTEILNGIARSRFVVADITTIEKIGDRAIRNANAMYEIGIAHAIRLPEEVILFRSDDDALLFDTSNIRVNRYSPDEHPADSQNAVAHAVIEATKEIDLRRHLAVQKAADSLNLSAQVMLAQAQSKDGLAYPEMQTAGQILGNTPRLTEIHRLLDIGAIKTKFESLTAETLAALGDSKNLNYLRYECTEFGRAVYLEMARRQGLFSPDVQGLLEARIKENEKKTSEN